MLDLMKVTEAEIRDISKKIEPYFQQSWKGLSPALDREMAGQSFLLVEAVRNQDVGRVGLGVMGIFLLGFLLGAEQC